MVDLWVQKAQGWLNTTYQNVPGYQVIDADGYTGWNTMFALTRAIQIELGITALSDTFGPTTFSKLSSQYPTIASGTTNTNIVAIVQCALWCKGYAGNDYTAIGFGRWDSTTSSSVATLRADMGLEPTASIFPKLMKSMLTLDSYLLRPNGSALVRTIQQSLNGRYSGRQDFTLMPTDGVVSRDVSTGLVYAVQYEIGMADGVANGNVGPGTQTGLKSAAAAVSQGSTDGSSRYWVHLFQAALAFNGAYDGSYNGTFSASMATTASAFQAFAGLPQTGKADFATWASLLVSTGDPNRPAAGFDCSQEVSSTLAGQLKSNGFTRAIRYLNGTGGKRIGSSELDRLWDAAMRWVPVYQEYNDAATEFSYDQGRAQGQRMVVRLRQLGVQSGATAYLAVDFDATDDDIDAVVLPHFRGVADAFALSVGRSYNLGVYGTRNVASRLAASNLTSSTFVSDMSTAYSGNLGFRLPTDWAYDQIQNLSSAAEGGPYSIEIDRDVVRKGAPSVGREDVLPTPRLFANGTPSDYDQAFFWTFAGLQYAVEASRPQADGAVTIRVMNEIVLNWLQKPTYWLGDGISLAGLAWSTAVTPQPTGATPEATHAIDGTRVAFESVAGGETYPAPATSLDSPVAVARFGDTAHWAASTRAWLAWPTASADDISIGDLASWGLDLVTFWADYDAERAKQPSGVLDVAEWTKQTLGGPADSSHFDAGDLRADMAAYLVADAMRSDPTRPLDDIVREALVAIEDDPGWLAKQFALKRFGDRATLVSCVTSLFEQPWPLSQGIDHFLGDARRPGEVTSTTVKPPPPNTLSAELASLAAGFADVVLRQAPAWQDR